MPRPTRRSRSLFLHCTALSDAEYAVYVDALYDVLELEGTGPGHGHGGEGVMVGDEELEGCLVGMREARAWMRGRYKDVSVADIAKVRAPCLLGSAFSEADTMNPSPDSWCAVFSVRVSIHRSCSSSSCTPRASASQAANSLLPSDSSCTCATGRS